MSFVKPNRDFRMVTPKKDIEMWQLEKFKALMPEFPTGSVTPSEEPDFLVPQNDRTLGIELTELHRASRPGAIPQQATEAMKRRVVERAHEIYAAKGMPPIRCAVLMGEGHILRSEVEPLAQAIVSIALKNMPARNSSSREEYTWTNRDYFPERIHSIHVNRHDIVSYNHFLCPGATWVGRLTAEDIARAVQSKENKYKSYRSRCDRAWLVINTDFEKMSTWFEFDSVAISAPVKSSFQRIFLLRHFAQELHELSIC